MRLSIITVNLNNRSGFERTLKSVFEQTNRDFESVVIDGLSDDGSLEIIKAHKGRIAKSVSEKDSGVFQAMNKGIRLAEGEYILFLNSGDYLYSRHTLANIFRQQFTEDFILFDVQRVKKDGCEVYSLDEDPKHVLISGPIFHQAVFHRRGVFQTVGLYNETFKVAADYELFLKAFFTAGCSYRIIHEVLSVYDNIYGLSSDTRNVELVHNERRKAQRTVFIPELVDALEEQYREIQSLSEIKSKYDGLMQSNTVRLALCASAALRRIRKLLGLKTPNNGAE
jgi:glycosyltransferase involved in cell wall biosynthesis